MRAVTRRRRDAGEIDPPDRKMLESRSGREARLNGSDYLHEMNHIRLLEDALDTVAVVIGERGLVQQLGIHHTACSKVFDDQVEKFQLICGERATLEKIRECAFRRLPV